VSRLRSLIPAVILLAGCALIMDSRSQAAVPLAGPIESIMPTFGDYQVANQVVSPEEQRVAGMSNYVARTYSSGGSIAFTTLVSYYDRQTQGKSIHSPRNCLPGAGWEIINGETRTITVDGVDQTVNRYVLKNRNATAIAYYWYQGRGRITANEYKVKWNLLRDAAVLGRTEEALVRIVVPVDSAGSQRGANKTQRADATAQQVAARLIADVNTVLPRTGGD
jgi:EpsI family protein